MNFLIEKTVLRMNIKNILMNINKDRPEIYTIFIQNG